jgi:hypothetical protein
LAPPATAFTAPPTKPAKMKRAIWITINRSSY